MSSNKPNVSLFFPVFKDEYMVELMVEKGLAFLKECANEYEVIIVNDCSPDKSGEIADKMAEKYPHVKVIHHPVNLGYGAALKSGFAAAKYEWICQTDGDNQYEINDFKKLLRVADYYDMVITFRYVKVYSTFRVFISYTYNRILSFLFNTRFRDISTGMRLIRREVLSEVQLMTDSPFIGAELTIKLMLRGFRIGEVGIQTFPRMFGKGESVTVRNIWLTIRDLIRIYREIFSANYEN